METQLFVVHTSILDPKMWVEIHQHIQNGSLTYGIRHRRKNVGRPLGFKPHNCILVGKRRPCLHEVTVAMSRNREFSDPFCDGECYIRSFGIKTVGMMASLAMLVGQVSEAQALLSSPIRALPRSAEAALRRSIPAFNKDVYQVQMELEEVQYQLRIPQRKPWKDMADHVATAAALIKMDSVLQGVLPGDMTTAKDIVTYIDQDVTKLMTAIQLKDADRTSIRVANALERISNLELLQVPGLPYPIPKQYQHLPRLNGRAVVQLALKKSNGANGFYNPDGLEVWLAFRIESFFSLAKGAHQLLHVLADRGHGY